MEAVANTLRTMYQVPGLHGARAGEMLFLVPFNSRHISGSKMSIHVIYLIAFHNLQ